MKKSYDKELSTKELLAMPDSDIDCSDIPELGDEFWENAEIRTPAKKAIYIKLDSDIVDWMKSQGKGYQTRINAILRSYYNATKDDHPRPKS